MQSQLSGIEKVSDKLEPLNIINPLSDQADPLFREMTEQYGIDTRAINEVGKIYPTPEELLEMRKKEDLE